MYSPTTGRFITTDPTGFQAGDVDLYRTEGNNPPDHTDAYGLYQDSDWRSIATFDGPDWAANGQKGCKSLVEYYQVRGTRGIGEGRFSQPAFATTDADWGPLKGTTNKYGGAFSMLELTGDGKPGGVCNTPQSDPNPPRRSDGDWLPHGGSLKAILRDFKAGTYRVVVKWAIEQRRKGPGGIGSIVNVMSPDAAGDLRKLIVTSSVNATNTQSDYGSNTKLKSDTAIVTVTVGNNGRADLLGLRLTIAGITGIASAKLIIGVTEIQKLG